MDPEQLRIDKWKMRASWFAPVITALVAVGAVWVTVRGDLRAQSIAADRETKARTLQLLAESGEAACSLTFSSSLDDLGKVFGDFDQPGSLCDSFREQPPGLPVQRELIGQLEEHPEQREQILAMWHAIYQADDWIDKIEEALRGSSAP